MKVRQAINNILTLASGSMLAQIIAILLSLLLARIYTPADFGLLGFLTTIFGLTGMVSTLKFDMAIVLAKNDDEARHIVRLSLWLVVLMGVLLSLAALIPLNLLVEHETKRFSNLPVILAGTMIIGFELIGNQLATHRRAFKLQSVSVILRALMVGLGQVIFGLLGLGAMGLIIGYFLGRIAGLTPLAIHGKNFFAHRSGQENEPPAVHFERAKATISRHRKFPLFLVPQQFVNAAYQAFPILTLPILFGAAETGLFFMAWRFMFLPNIIIVGAVRRVFFKEASGYEAGDRDLIKLYFLATALLSLLGICGVVLIWGFGEELFALLLGEKWRLSGSYAIAFLAVWFTSMINAPSTTLYVVYGWQRALMNFEIVRLVCIVAAAFLISYDNAQSYILVYSLISALFNIAIIFHVGYFTVTKSDTLTMLRKIKRKTVSLSRRKDENKKPVFED